MSSLAESQGGRESVTEELERVREDGQMQVAELMGKLEDKSRAGKCYTVLVVSKMGVTKLYNYVSCGEQS